MTTSYSQEFETVDVVINSTARTCGVDAFALSVIKTERQIRKLVTHLIYQFPCFGPDDVPSVRHALVNNRRVYFDGFENGFNAIYPLSISTLVGSDYLPLRDRIREAVDHRNKIFHGQLTSNNLTRDDLLAYVGDIRTWCKSLAGSALAEFGYDGFAWNSFRKSTIPDLEKRLKIQIANVAEYEEFVRLHMQR
ncbi:MAG: hypothetical protein ACRD3L_14500 [Terriglobales bacterium]